MLVIPAIDIKDGQCVRLRQGRREEATVFSDDPLAQARHWVEQGARRLHIVDLDGAFAGAPVNSAAVAAIASTFPQLPIQVGGGVRTLESARMYADAGVSYLIIGTQAVKDPGFVRQACAAFPGKIIIGVDAVAGRVATEGWADVSDLAAEELVGRFSDIGVTAVIYTDISRDGMMQGANLEATVALAERSAIPVIASGGIAKLADIADLQAASSTRTGAGIIGAITGRALYQGRLDLREAQACCDAEA